MSVPGSDAALINAIRSGEPGAYDVLRSRHGAAARRLASHLPRGQATVNDVVDWAFVQVLEAIRRGGGPTDAFRPYLLTAVQRAARDCAAGENSPIPTDDQDIPDPGQLMTGGPAGNGREETGTGGATGPAAIAAFMSLPERWRAVLWHTEVEDAAPAAVASLFGLGAAEAADLADRAREGMAQNAGIEPDGVHAVLRHAVAPAVLGAGCEYLLDDHWNRSLRLFVGKSECLTALCDELRNSFPGDSHPWRPGDADQGGSQDRCRCCEGSSAAGPAGSEVIVGLPLLDQPRSE